MARRASSKRQRLRVVFDLDDTLYPERQFAVSGFRACADWLAREHGKGDGAADEMVRLLDEGHMRALFEIVLAEHLPGHDADTLETFIDVYRLHDPAIALYDDAHDVIEHFGAQAPLGLITDGQTEVQSSKVRALRLEPRFAHIVYTHALGGRAYSKPHPRAFELMEEALGEPGDRFVYIGDNPAKDFVVPNARGWISIQIHRPQRIHARAVTVPGGTPQHEIHTLADLPALLSEVAIP